MNNAVVQLQPAQGALAQQTNGGRMAVAEIISHVAVVQEVMRAVMKENVHFGKIPGTDKPTLYKAGAEVLCMVFRVADTYEVTDLSTSDCVRYRVNCIGTHQMTGTVLGAGMGEASSGEEKYKWRKAINPQEWDETPANLRRKKHSRGKGGSFYIQDQVRTEPADLANTILKMANKRAKMAMVLNVTAASDCFSQDLEDMDDALRDHLARHESEAPAQDESAAPPTWPDDAFDKQLPKMLKAIKDGKPIEEIIAWAESKGALTEAQKARIGGGKVSDAPVFTYAQVAQRIGNADDADALAIARDLIPAVADEQQRKELNKLADLRETQLKE